MLTFVKDYKEQESLRLSFDALARETFGISFEKWYQEGYWDGHYIPYSFSDEGRIVSNVSANRMTIYIDGIETHAIQIGTVMTHPDYRRRGLAYELLQKVFEDFDETAAFYYLAADSDAKPLYKKCDFMDIPVLDNSLKNPESNSEYNLERNIVSSKGGVDLLKNQKISLDALIHWKQNSPIKNSGFEVIDDAHILAFYWFHGFDAYLYTLGSDVVLIAEYSETDKIMVLYDYYHKGSLAISELIDMLWKQNVVDIDEIKIAFDVRGLPIQVESLADQCSGWMVRKHKAQQILPKFCYPKISQA